MTKKVTTNKYTTKTNSTFKPNTFPVNTIPSFNYYIQQHLSFGDKIIRYHESKSHIIFSNITILEMSSHTEIFEIICNYMHTNNAYISCMSEINFHWKKIITTSNE